MPLIENWFDLHFVENPGMAFGWEIPFLGPDGAKILLSLFRIMSLCRYTCCSGVAFTFAFVM